MTARAETKHKPKAGDRSRGRVLLITDEDQSQFIDAIAERGIDVVGVSNGTAALVSLQRSRPHLVVADIKARGLRMRELGKMLAQSDDGIPLVLVGSERSTLSARRAALQNGAFDYFEFPAEIELLVERTQQLVLLRQKIDEEGGGIIGVNRIPSTFVFRHLIATRENRGGIRCVRARIIGSGIGLSTRCNK
jgi:DNA-binding response OmpR family regulator